MPLPRQNHSQRRYIVGDNGNTFYLYYRRLLHSTGTLTANPIRYDRMGEA